MPVALEAGGRITVALSPVGEEKIIVMPDIDLRSLACLPSNLLTNIAFTRVGTLIVATIYLQLIQNGYMFRSFAVLHCSHQHCVQPVASDVEVVGYL